MKLSPQEFSFLECFVYLCEPCIGHHGNMPIKLLKDLVLYMNLIKATNFACQFII